MRGFAVDSSRQCRKMTHAQCEGLLSAKGLPSCSDHGSQWERSGAIFISPQKGRRHLKHDFRLTERLLPDSTMTYRGRSDGLVVESDRKKNITFNFTCHLRDLQGYCVYTSGGFFFLDRKSTRLNSSHT